MNNEGCPTGYRRDNLLLYEPSPFAACEVPLAAYITLSCMLILGRFAFTAITWRQWLDFKRRMRTKRRVPLNPILNTLMLAFQALLFILSGFDIVSSRDGTSGLIFGLWAIVYYGVALLLFKKLIGLGTKLAFSQPKSKRSTKDVRPQSSNKDGKGDNDAIDKAYDDVQKLDFRLKLAAIIIIISAVLQFVFFVVLGTFVYPGALFAARGGFGTSGIVLLVMLLGLCWQFERCIRAVQRSTYFNLNNDASLPIKMAVRKMRQQQIAVMLVTVPSGSIHLLHAANVVPVTWIWVFVHCSLDILLILMFVASNLWKRWARTAKSSDPSSPSSTGRGAITMRQVSESTMQSSSQRVENDQ